MIKIVSIPNFIKIFENMLEIKTSNAKKNQNFLLILSQIFGINSKTAYKLSQNFTEYTDLLSCDNEQLKQFGLNDLHIEKLRHPDWEEIEKIWQWIEENSKLHHIVTLNDEIYPKFLQEVYHPPLILYVKGNVKILSQPQIAIVGSRNSSYQGNENALSLAKELVKENWIITSGLALGIDAFAHQGALEGNGKTIAVMGTGLDHIYPRSNKKLAENIIENDGALVSEFPLAYPPCAKNFPQRNRIISGLSVGVVVIEANLRSGSLITARLAMEQGREVFALPGSIHNLLAKGCHQLIRQGAKLIDSVTDITEELPKINLNELNDLHNKANLNNSIPTTSIIQEKISKNEKILLQCLNDDTPTSLDVMACRSNLTITEIMAMLTHMELDDKVRKIDGGYIKIHKTR